MKPAFLAIALSLLGCSSHADQRLPDHRVIRQWLKRTTPDAEYFSPQQSEIRFVRLTNGELGYLATVMVNGKSRNEMFRTALIRPAIQDARLLPIEAQHLETIYDLDDDGVSEVVFKESGSGNGSERGWRRITQLDGTNIVELRKTKIDNFDGFYPTTDSRSYTEQCSYILDYGKREPPFLLEELCENSSGGIIKEQVKKKLSMANGQLIEVN